MVSFTILLIASFVATSKGLEILGQDANSYVEVQPDKNQFKYGYQVRRVNDQFQHKYKSPQNVTFGCYGYTQTDVGRELRVFYVADQFGYRTVEVGQIVTIFPQPGNGPVVQKWLELPFPAACFRDEVADDDQSSSSSDNNPTVVRPENDSERWRPFGSDGNSFIKSMQCSANEKSDKGLITLYYPFRIACSEMESFETQLNQLVAQFDHS